jgi:hypothetical protein
MVSLQFETLKQSFAGNQAWKLEHGKNDDLLG